MNERASKRSFSIFRYCCCCCCRCRCRCCKLQTANCALTVSQFLLAQSIAGTASSPATAKRVCDDRKVTTRLIIVSSSSSLLLAPSAQAHNGCMKGLEHASNKLKHNHTSAILRSRKRSAKPSIASGPQFRKRTSLYLAL